MRTMFPNWWTVLVVAVAVGFIGFMLGVAAGSADRLVPRRWVQCSGWVDDRTFTGWCGEIAGYWVIPARPPARSERP